MEDVEGTWRRRPMGKNNIYKLLSCALLWAAVTLAACSPKTAQVMPEESPGTAHAGGPESGGTIDKSPAIMESEASVQGSYTSMKTGAPPAPKEITEEPIIDAGKPEMSVEAVPATKFSGVTGVNVATLGELTKAEIMTDGTPAEYEIFSLRSPDRVVVEIVDAGELPSERIVETDTPHVKGVKIDRYRDRIRVVFESKGQVPYELTKEKDRIVVFFGAKPAVPMEKTGEIKQKEAPPAVMTPAGTKSQKAPRAVKVDFKEVELPVFIRLVSDVTGKNFTFDEKVTGKVTVISPKEVSVDELYQLFLSVLQFKGYTTVPTDNLIQIIPLSDAKQNWTQVLTEEGVGEGFVTRLIPLNFLNANEGIRVLTPLISRNGVIAAYVPTNTIILTDSAMNVERLVALLSSLDKEPPPGKGKINVYALENADAEDLAKTLTNLFSKQPPAGSQPGAGAGLTGPVNVTADKSTNSLIITASPEDYDSVKAVIANLDLRRRQVYVEAAIMEISLSRMRELGVEFRAMELPQEGTVTGFGGTNFGGINAAISGPAGLAELSGVAAGVVKGTFTFGGTEFMNVGALVRALQTQGDVNVLSTPHLLTTDNQKAEIVVGENVPFVTGQSQSTGGNILTTIERKDVGITLRLTPKVSEGEFVKLDIYQEISSLTESATFDVNKVGPVVNKRYASTTVVAKDGETIAIGGLLRDNQTKTIRKVPLLGDIPVLGWLFRYYKKQVDKTNLLIFITPTIVKETTLSDLTKRKREELELSKKEMERTK